LLVDVAVSHPENHSVGHIAYVLGRRGLDAVERHLQDSRTDAIPDYVIYWSTDVPRGEARKDTKIRPIAQAEDMQQTRELADDVEARVLYMLHKLGITPQSEQVKLSA